MSRQLQLTSVALQVREQIDRIDSRSIHFKRVIINTGQKEFRASLAYPSPHSPIFSRINKTKSDVNHICPLDLQEKTDASSTEEKRNLDSKVFDQSEGDIDPSMNERVIILNVELPLQCRKVSIKLLFSLIKKKRYKKIKLK